MDHDPRVIAGAITHHGTMSKAYGYLRYDNYQKLVRVVRRLIQRDILSRHIVVPLEKTPSCSIAVMRKQQLINGACLGRSHRIIARYISFAGSPVEIYYVNGDCEELTYSVKSPGCVLDSCEKIMRTLVSIHGANGEGIELRELGGEPTRLDDIDAQIMYELFRLFNPPVIRFRTDRELLKLIGNRLGLSNVHYHYYAHIYKSIFENYVARDRGEYILITAWSPGISDLRLLLEELMRRGLMTSYWQVHLLSENPVASVIHGWGYFERFLEQSHVHDYIENTAYTVYPVIGVDHG